MATISSDILARYAADAAREVEGVRSFVERPLPRHKGVRVVEKDGAVRVELHLEVEWGTSIPVLGRAVQKRVTEYLRRMAQVSTARVDVVVDAVAGGPVKSPQAPPLVQ
jgi:uncharacterized alkaline shock family protein YloU